MHPPPNKTKELVNMLERVSVESLMEASAGKIEHARKSSNIEGVMAFRLRLFVWQEKKNGKREELENETDVILNNDDRTEILEHVVSRYNYLVGRANQYSYLAGYKGWVRIDICYVDIFGSITYSSDTLEQKFE